jgi:hypothetical protein
MTNPEKVPAWMSAQAKPKPKRNLAHIIAIEPRPLFPGSRVMVSGIASDCSPELIAKWTQREAR